MCPDLNTLLNCTGSTEKKLLEISTDLRNSLVINKLFLSGGNSTNFVLDVYYIFNYRTYKLYRDTRSLPCHLGGWGKDLEPPLLQRDLDLSVILIVSFALDPSSGVSSEQVLPALIVHKDEKGEGECRQPPVEVQRVHSQTLVHTGAVGQERCQHSLKDESKVHEPILHALLEHRVLPCLTDNEISPLDNNN